MSVIVDTGPLVAFINKKDQFHLWSKKVFESISPPLITCESVISESVYLLKKYPNGVNIIFQILERGLVKVDFSLANEINNVKGLVEKYSDVLMSVADACLVRLAELNPKTPILTVDSDFLIYKMFGNKSLVTISPIS
ncbi:MAG: PIN domain-containing protein [Chloroherpetonaceae bacterium]|nr:PIN domain-containing protein [Chloroherpetonaceae bacterium]